MRDAQGRAVRTQATSAVRGKRAKKRSFTVERLEDRLVLSTPGASLSGVLMYHDNPLQTGANTSETALTPRNVGSSDFGKLFSVKVNGQVYAQPLYVSGLMMSDGTRHNVVVVATETDRVYAIDADNPKAGPNHDGILWMRNYTDTSKGITPVPSAEINVKPIAPDIGITGTPVIDPSTGTMYFVTDLKQQSGPPFTKSGTYTMQIHAVNVTTGQELPDSPTLIAQTTVDSNGNTTVTTPVKVPGVGSGSNQGVVPLTSTTMLQRPGLVLDTNVPGHSGPVVFAAFGSTHDAEPYHGWLVGWDAASLKQYSVFNTTPNGYGASLWQSGGAPAVLPNGNLVITTGNGAFNAQTTSAPGASALGYSDFGLGYAGLDHSAAVTFSTVIPQSVNNSTGLFFNGVVPTANPRPADGTFLNINNSNVDFNLAGRDQAGPHTIKVTLNYDISTKTLSETIEDTTTRATYRHDYPDVNLPNQVGGDTAYVGFGGSTDARLANNDITGWTLSSNGSPIVSDSGGFASHGNLTANGAAKFTSSDAASGTVA